MTFTRTAIAAALAASLAAGAAIAAEPNRPGPQAPQTRAEAQARAGEMFARMDANKDGKLDAADREARRAGRFDKVDGNKDGQISREEFAAHHAGMANHHEGSRHEGGHRMGGHHGKHGGEGRMGGMMAGMADANGDKAISQQEFTAAALRRFDAVDTNKDGTISAAERQAARGMMRERMRDMRRGSPST